MKCPVKTPGDSRQHSAYARAQKKKVTQPAQSKAKNQMQPHPSLLQHSGSEKEHPKRRQPKKHVQDFSAPAPRPCVPHEPQQVIEKAQQKARRKTQEKREGLALWGEAHPRNRRLRRPG